MALLCAAWLALLSPVPPARAAQAAAVPSVASSEATVVFHNRTVAVLRSSQFGMTPADRARRARDNIERALAAGGPGRIDTEALGAGVVVKVDGRFAFALMPDDVDRGRDEAHADAVREAVTRLGDAIGASRESRELAALLRGIGRTAVATGVTALLVHGLGRAVPAVGRRLLRLIGHGAGRLGLHRAALLQRRRLSRLVRRALRGLYWGLVALVLFQWLGIVLDSFAYTRPWGEQLTHFLLGVLGGLGWAILHALPDLLVATIIFALAALSSRGLGAFLERAARLPGTLVWLDADTVGPVRRMANAALWLFALAMAYPYLPGSGTEAFKGLSVLVGLMVSLGGSSLVGQAARRPAAWC